jgi:hypothetical protein
VDGLSSKSKGKAHAKSRMLEMNVSNITIYFFIDKKNYLILYDPNTINENKAVCTIISVKDFEKDFRTNLIRDWYDVMRNSLNYVALF